MMPTRRKRLLFLAVLVPLLLLGTGLYESETRVVRGWLKSEAFYHGKPTSWWSKEFSRWHEIRSAFIFGPVDAYDWSDLPPEWYPPLMPWENWIYTYAPRLRPYLPNTPTPRILEGDSSALGVLRELLEDASPQVRRMAARGLGKMEADARPAVGELLRRLEDPDAGVRDEVQAALRAIHPVATARAGVR